jgi:drug/metabolite transporter (DMT)-like permease
LSNILFRAGMERMGGLPAYTPVALLVYGWRMLSNGLLVLGTFMRILFTAVSFLVLTWADYSFVIPASAVNYAIVAMMGSLFLGESVSPERWIGIGFICLGVALVGTTPASTTHESLAPGSQILKPAHPSVRQEHRGID